MQTNSFIPTPIHTNYQQENFDSEFDRDERWQKRARKLQERRWRKLSSKRVRLEDHLANPKDRLSDYEFRARRLAHW